MRESAYVKSFLATQSSENFKNFDLKDGKVGASVPKERCASCIEAGGPAAGKGMGRTVAAATLRRHSRPEEPQ